MRFLLFLSLLLAHRRHGPAWTLTDARGRGGADTRRASRDGGACRRVANSRLGARGSPPRPGSFNFVVSALLPFTGLLLARSVCALFLYFFCPFTRLTAACCIVLGRVQRRLDHGFFHGFSSRAAAPFPSVARTGNARSHKPPHKTKKQTTPTTKNATGCGGRPAATRVAHETRVPPPPPRAETRTGAPRGSRGRGPPKGTPTARH